LKKFLKGSQNY